MIRTQLPLLAPASSSPEDPAPRTNPLFLRMQTWIAEQLHQTGHFSSIETGYSFPRHKTHLNFARAHHIYAVRKPEYTGEGQLRNYLVLPSIAPLGSVPALRQKLAHLAELNVAICPVLTDYMSEGYLQPAHGALRTSLWRLPPDVRDRVRVITREEDYWNRLTQGHVPYYLPPVSALRVTDLSTHVQADYRHSTPPGNAPHDVLPPTRLLQTIRDPRINPTCSAFTLQLLPRYGTTSVATPVLPQVYERELAVENLVYHQLRAGLVDIECLEERVAIQLDNQVFPYDFARIVDRIAPLTINRVS